LQALHAIRDRVPRYAKQPGGEWRATPLEFAQIRERLMKDVRSQLLCRRTLANSPRDKGINAFEVRFIQFGKTARVLLCRLYQGSFI
jgi:hypothetical protein